MFLPSSQTYSSPGISRVIRMDLFPMDMMKGKMKSRVTGQFQGPKTTKDWFKLQVLVPILHGEDWG